MPDESQEIVWVDIVRKAPLWESIPDQLRVTDDEIVSAWRGMSEHYRDQERARLTEARCEIAVQVLKYRDKWLPCAGQVNDDGRRCAQHGGPKKIVKRNAYADLRAENDELRRRLAELEAAKRVVA